MQKGGTNSSHMGSEGRNSENDTLNSNKMKIIIIKGKILNVIKVKITRVWERVKEEGLDQSHVCFLVSTMHADLTMKLGTYTESMMGAQDSRLHVLLVYSVNMVKSTWADQPFH
jgi:hypothetical protein